MQQALPTTLGVKIAGWLDALLRHLERLEETGNRCLVLQFGGAVGTLAALGSRGPDVANALATELKLGLPRLAWHSNRDRITEIGATLGMLAGTVGKIARDLALHMQTELGEIFEPAEEGRGGSSTMPHKRNPVSCAVMLGAALRVPALVGGLLASMMQEEERGLGGWHAACARAVRERRNLRDALSADPKIAGLLSEAELDCLFDPRKYLGAAEEYVRGVVAASRSALSERRK